MTNLLEDISRINSKGTTQNPVNVNVYHGSGQVFDKFDQSKSRIENDHMGGGVGYFTSNPDVAKTYAKSMARKSNTEPQVYHTNLKMKNVFDVDHEFTGDKLKHVLPDDHEGFARGAGLMKVGGDKYKTLNDLKDGKLNLKGHEVFKGLSRGGVNTAGARQHLIKKGYDGMRYNGGVNMDMATKHDVYMPYNANSITIKKREPVNKVPAMVDEERKMTNTFGLPKSLINAAKLIGEESEKTREQKLVKEQEYKMENGYLEESWKYHQYSSDDEARSARKAHFDWKDEKGQRSGNPCRHLRGGKLAYMGEFKGPKPTKKVQEELVIEEWSVYDQKTGKIISKHGEHQAPALSKARELNSAEWDKTKKRDRYKVIAPDKPHGGVKAAKAIVREDINTKNSVDKDWKKADAGFNNAADVSKPNDKLVSDVTKNNKIFKTKPVNESAVPENRIKQVLRTKEERQEARPWESKKDFREEPRSKNTQEQPKKKEGTDFASRMRKIKESIVDEGEVLTKPTKQGKKIDKIIDDKDDGGLAGYIMRKRMGENPKREIRKLKEEQLDELGIVYYRDTKNEHHIPVKRIILREHFLPIQK
ncbi:MAG: hypothetical protein P4L79_10760 [Legionella sp.]|uniref:ADP-ribosyltransferase-containing protein n=1 Tax=Legionella sp. TaxID=459 RepID=UPI00284B598A|nr:hypothetical protein [Legionella sp.]